MWQRTETNRHAELQTDRSEKSITTSVRKLLRISYTNITIFSITHTHPFNGPFSRTTWMIQYQNGKTNLDFTGARDSEWQWHQLGHMQVCTLLQTDNHASTPPLSFYRPDAFPAAQPTASKHWRHFFYFIFFLQIGKKKRHRMLYVYVWAWSCMLNQD